jgi:Mn2+/Fe2+ NRAMP family transporter
VTGRTPEAAPGHSRTGGWIDVVATTVLALAAVATAWSGYQASRWHGEQAIAFSRANASRLESNDYVLGVVLFSVALFFAGISSRLGAPGHGP